MHTTATVFSWIIFAAGLYVLLMSLLNVAFMRRQSGKAAKAPRSGGKVSVIIPARNEEKNIGKLLDSLMDQDWPDYEILVIDDNSTDRTWEIIEERRAKRPDLIRSFKGGPKHDRVLNGKTWALSQIAPLAKGEWILATDADTVHRPNSISKGVAYAKNLGLDMVSGFPQERCPTWTGSSCIAAMNFATTFYIPMWYCARRPTGVLTLANGQYILMKREALEAVGGYNAIDRQICDDVRLAKHFIKNGKRYALVKVSDIIACDMYGNFAEAFKGISRSVGGVFPASRLSIIPIGVVVLLLLAIALSPFAAVPMWVLAHPAALQLTAGYLMMCLGWFLTCREQGFPVSTSLSFSFTLLLTCAMYIHSYAVNVQGKPFIWKDREIVRGE